MGLTRSETTYQPGDVLTYTPERDHCRETTAYVTPNGHAVDTYWGPYGDGQSHVLTEAELATATVRFNVDGYEALGRYFRGSRAIWETYHPNDRERIPSQHGHQEALFVRRGAQPDLDTQIANAQEKVTAAESDLRIAEYRLEMRRRDLAELREQHR